MTDDFALIDFAISTRPAAEIALAIGRLQDSGAFSAPPEGTLNKGAGAGFLGRLIGRDGAASGDQMTYDPLKIQPNGTLPGPIVRQEIDDGSANGAMGPVRISGPHGRTGVTLIEFRDGDDGPSPLCAGISKQMPGEELFCFRYSGQRHPGAHYAFQVYDDGRITRNAYSRSPSGTAPEADWQGADDGMPHPFETDSLPAPTAPKSDIMTPDRQASILHMIGVEPSDLIGGSRDNMTVFELTTDPAGTPLDEARAIPASAESTPAEHSQPSSDETAIPPAQGATPFGPGQHSPVKKRAASLAPWEAQQPAPSWEEEVTTLLLRAAQSGLPQGQQVGWLEGLTGKLESGEIDSALAEAMHVIQAGSMSDDDRTSAMNRLAELFGRGG